MGKKNKKQKHVHQNDYASMSQAPKPEELKSATSGSSSGNGFGGVLGRGFGRRIVGNSEYEAQAERRKLDRAYRKGRAPSLFQRPSGLEGSSESQTANTELRSAFDGDSLRHRTRLDGEESIPQGGGVRELDLWRNYQGVSFYTNQANGGLNEEQILEILPQVKIAARESSRQRKAQHYPVLYQGKTVLVAIGETGGVKLPLLKPEEREIQRFGFFGASRIKNEYGMTDDPKRVSDYKPAFTRGFYS